MRKNLTKAQVEIEGLAKRVPKLTDKQREWATKNFVYDIHILGVSQREFACPECKEKVLVPASRSGNEIRCPHCGARISTMRHFDSYGWKWNKNGVKYGGYANHQEGFFQVMSVVGDWQVTRLFYIHRFVYLRKENTGWGIHEVCQGWNNPKYHLTHFRSLPKNGMGWHFNPYSLHTWGYECTNPDNWSYNKYIVADNGLEARIPGGNNYFNTDNICPNGKILPSYKKMGVSMSAIKAVKSVYALALMESLSGKNYKPMYETLLKSKDYAIYDLVTKKEKRDKVDMIFSAWKICQRNHYDFGGNITEWIDYLDLLIKRGMDYRNPHFVCPADLHGAHNHVLELERRDEERREEQRRRERIERMHEQTKNDAKNWESIQKAFVKRREKYFGLCIESDLFTIVPLKSIDEFRYEGTYLNHCVFRCGYYRKEDSLILSARDGHNNPIETIEINLRSFCINQCYGVGDTHTALHDKIVKTMNDNMWRVREIASGKKKKARVAA